jgi:lysyl endopeptidase
MTRSRLLTGLLLLALGWTGVLTPATAQDRPQLPSQQHQSAIQALEAVQQRTLPAVDTEALRAEDREQADEIGPYRYGTVVDTDLRPDQDGTWEQLPSGKWLWRLRIESRDAVSLSIGFTQFQLPDGAMLFVSDEVGRLVHGPYTAADATAGQHWTPLVKGEVIIVELSVPASRRQDLGLTIGKVGHGYRSLQPSGSDEDLSKAGTCNVDVACDEADPWRDQVRSVARYTYESGSDILACTGSLVNTTREGTTPYFLTAEHCVDSPEVAQTMVFYWNYQNETCRTLGSPENGEKTDAPLDQTLSGATLVARYGNVHDKKRIRGKPDLTLVEIDDQIPENYNLFFNGWSRRDQATQEAVTIHHPKGHGKRISFDRDESTITGFGQRTQGNTHLRVGNWELGTTEGGSSGSPIFDSNKRIVGVLSGGRAGCGNDGDAEDNNEPDWYGRLALGFESGDYQDRTLEEVLDPTSSGSIAINGRSFVLDSIPPGQPTSFSVQNVTPDSVTLSWSAPPNDSSNTSSGPAREYLLRYRTDGPIRTDADFEGATPATNVPGPKSPGSPQAATVAVQEDSSYYFGLVALDNVDTSRVSTISRDVTPVSNLRVTSSPAPNPTRSVTRLQFVTRKNQNIRVALYDALGRRLRVLLDEDVRPFRRETVSVDVSSLTSGMYFVRIRGDASAQTAQVSVVK